MTADPTPTTTQASSDRLSPLRLVTASDRPGYAQSPAFWRLIATVEDDDDRRATWLRYAEEAAGRVG